MVTGLGSARGKRRLSVAAALSVCAGVLALAASAEAATIVRSISNETQLMQLFTDANADPSNTYQGNLSARTYALTQTLALTKGSVELRGATSLSLAGSYILDCQNRCNANGAKGQVFRVVRASGYTGTLRLKLTGVTVTRGWSSELSLRGGGGALVENGTLEITYSIIRNNKANQWGAGLAVMTGGSLFLTGSIVRDNENDQIGLCGNGDTAFGGGIGVYGGLASITGSSITGNRACKGAGIALWGPTGTPPSLSLYSSTVSGNSSNYHGGGILFRGPTKYAHISFSTIVYNAAGVARDSGDVTYGGGIGFRNFSVAAGAESPAIRMWGTILAKNTLEGQPVGAIGADCFADSTSVLDASKMGVASNFVGKNGNCGTFLNWTSTTGGSTLIGTETSPLDPLVNSTTTGGTTAPLANAPLTNSPVLSEYAAGNRSRNLPASACPTTDIAQRNRGSGPTAATHCDIGSYEASTCFTTSFTPLTLDPAWSHSGWGAPPAVALDCEGQVIFKGAIQTSVGNAQAFTLPANMRPSTRVYLPIDLLNATKGRLVIDPSTGAGLVYAETAWSNAQGFTSLDGPSFALNQTAFTSVSLQNGWYNAPYSTRNVAYSTAGGIVRLQGAMATSGTNMLAFTLPPGARPPSNTYVTVDLCSGTKGRVLIASTGAVTVVPFESKTSNAQCFTSLEGVWFALSGTGYSTLSLQNGWTHAPFTTRNAAVSVERGIVRFQGAIATSTGNTNMDVFTLPVGARPSTSVWLPVNLCGAAGGRINVYPSGQVTVQAESAASHATCFTSLEGVRFGL